VVSLGCASLGGSPVSAPGVGTGQVLAVAVSAAPADCSLFPRDWLFHVRWNRSARVRALGEGQEGLGGIPGAHHRHI